MHPQILEVLNKTLKYVMPRDNCHKDVVLDSSKKKKKKMWF